MGNYNFSVEDIKELKSMVNELSFYLKKDIQSLKLNKCNKSFIQDKELYLYEVKSMYDFLSEILEKNS